MFGKNELIKEFIDWLEKHGIDPLLPIALILLLFGVRGVKDLRKWNTLSQTEKAWDILYFAGFLLIILYYLFEFLRSIL